MDNPQLLMMSRSQTSLPPPSGNIQAKPLFGASTTSQPQQQSTSLFGAPSSSTNTQQGGGLFGGLANQNQGGGVFGSQQTQQAQPQQNTGLFGSALGQTQPTHTSGPFGSTLNNQSKGSLFGASQDNTQSQLPNLQQRAPVNIFSNSIGQTSQQQQTVPGVRISVNELRPTTRYGDLHDELQKAIEFVDNFVLNKIQWQEQCEAASGMLEELCQQIQPDVEHCARSLDNVQHSLENDAENISLAKNILKVDATDARISFKIINNLKLPQQFHHANLWSSVSAPQHTGPTFPEDSSDEGESRNLVDYFSRQSDEMSKTVASYKRNVAEVEAYLRGVESHVLQQMQQLAFTRGRDIGENDAEDQVRELAGVLREFENGILSVAMKVGNTREVVQSTMLGPVNLGERSRFPQHGS